jgi:hypothetical protein
MLNCLSLLPAAGCVSGLVRFLDRCDPDAAGDTCQAELLQAWLQHPLLDHLATHPQAMLTLLHRLHQAAPAPAAATASLAAPAAAAASLVAAAGQGSGADTVAVTAGGGMSPGALLLAMLLKMGESAFRRCASCSCCCCVRRSLLCQQLLHTVWLKHEHTGMLVRHKSACCCFLSVINQMSMLSNASPLQSPYMGAMLFS